MERRVKRLKGERSKNSGRWKETKKGRKEGRTTRDEKKEVRYTRSRCLRGQAEGLQLREGEEKRERRKLKRFIPC